jgi:spermidine synthase
MMTLTLPIHARHILRVLVTIALLLAVLSISFQILADANQGDAESFISVAAQLTNSNLEASIPTWYATSLLLACSVLLAVIALARRIHKDRYARHWIGLAVIFLYMSLDEGAMIHEELTDPLRSVFNVTHYLYFAWMIVGVPVALGVVLVYAKFLLDLPPRIRRLFILAGMSFISGAVIIEAFSANMWYLDEGGSLPYMIVGTIEEFFEMLGVIILIYALLLHIGQIQLTINLDLAQETTLPPQTQTAETQAYPRQRIISFAILIGFGVALLQWTALQELSALSGSNDLLMPAIIVLLTALAAGYMFSGEVPHSWLRPLAVISLLLSMTLPLWFRLLAVALDSAGAARLTPVFMPILTAAATITPLSILLPRIARSAKIHPVWIFGLLLPGVAGAALLVMALGEFNMQMIYAILSAVLFMGLMLLSAPKYLTGLFAAASIAWTAFLPTLDHMTNALLFRSLHHLPAGTQTIFSGYSRCQKVDVLMTPDGRRYLYLGGRTVFTSDENPQFNIYMGTVPALLAKPKHALVIGSGVMQMERLIASHAGHVTTIEPDPLVVQAAQEYFDDFNLMSSLSNRTIILDDPPRYIADTNTQYDLVSITLLDLSEATAYYEALADRLKPGGLLIVDLKDHFGRDQETARQTAGALTDVFDEVMIVTLDSTGRSAAYAANKLPFTRNELLQALFSQGETQFTLYDATSQQSAAASRLQIIFGTAA